VADEIDARLETEAGPRRKRGLAVANPRIRVWSTVVSKPSSPAMRSRIPSTAAAERRLAT